MSNSLVCSVEITNYMCRFSTFCCFIFLACAFGCTTPNVATEEQQPVTQGECLLVKITSDRDPTKPYQVRQIVDSAGDIELPFLGKLHVAGLTLHEVESLIDKRFVPRESNLSIVVTRGSLKDAPIHETDASVSALQRAIKEIYKVDSPGVSNAIWKGEYRLTTALETNGVYTFTFYVQRIPDKTLKATVTSNDVVLRGGWFPK